MTEDVSWQDGMFYELECPICRKREQGALFYLVESATGSGKHLVCHAHCRGDRKRVDWVPSHMFTEELVKIEKQYQGVRVEVRSCLDPNESDPDNFHRVGESPHDRISEKELFEIDAMFEDVCYEMQPMVRSRGKKLVAEIRRLRDEEDVWNVDKAHMDKMMERNDMLQHLLTVHGKVRERTDRILTELLDVKRLADGGGPALSAQGQAMDGYTELAAYRSILVKLEEQIGLSDEEIQEAPSYLFEGGRVRAVEEWCRKPISVPQGNPEWRAIASAKRKVLELLGFDTGPTHDGEERIEKMRPRE